MADDAQNTTTPDDDAWRLYLRSEAERLRGLGTQHSLRHAKALEGFEVLASEVSEPQPIQIPIIFHVKAVRG